LCNTRMHRQNRVLDRSIGCTSWSPVRIRPDHDCLKLSHSPFSKMQSAPLPAFCRISFGSIVQTSLVTFSTVDPVAPPEATPAAARVANNSLAARPLRETFRSPRLRSSKVSSHARDTMSVLLTRQPMESAVTEIFRPAGKLMGLPANSRAIHDGRRTTAPASAGLPRLRAQQPQDRRYFPRRLMRW
jgi:hypothetical protein